MIVIRYLDGVRTSHNNSNASYSVDKCRWENPDNIDPYLVALLHSAGRKVVTSSDGEPLWMNNLAFSLFTGVNHHVRTDVSCFEEWKRANGYLIAKEPAFKDLVARASCIEELPFRYPTIIRATAVYLKKQIVVLNGESGMVSVYPPVMGPFTVTHGMGRSVPSELDTPSYNVELPSKVIPQSTRLPETYVVIRRKGRDEFDPSQYIGSSILRLSAASGTTSVYVTLEQLECGFQDIYFNKVRHVTPHSTRKKPSRDHIGPDDEYRRGGLEEGWAEDLLDDERTDDQSGMHWKALLKKAEKVHTMSLSTADTRDETEEIAIDVLRAFG